MQLSAPLRVALLTSLWLVLVMAVSPGQHPVADANVIKATVDAWGDSFLYIDRFCFAREAPSGQDSVGTIEFTASGSTSGMTFVLFDDTPSSWPSVDSRISDMTCQEVVAAAKISMPLMDMQTTSGSWKIPVTGEFHYYYAGLVACVPAMMEETMRFTLTMVNSESSWWSHQFSWDSQGLLEIYLVFFILYTLLVASMTYTVLRLRSMATNSPLLNLAALAVGTVYIGTLFEFIHYAKFASDGIGVQGLKGFADVMGLGARLTFLALLLCMAHGWTITVPYLRRRSVFVAIFAALILLHVALYMWAQISMDPSSTTYIYDTPPGIVIACVRLPICAWFIIMAKKTHDEEQHSGRKRLYKLFTPVFTVWLLVLPIMVLVAGVVQPWYRLKLVASTTATFFFLALSFMQVLMWPHITMRMFSRGGPAPTPAVEKAGAEGVYEPL